MSESILVLNTSGGCIPSNIFVPSISFCFSPYLLYSEMPIFRKFLSASSLIMKSAIFRNIYKPVMIVFAINSIIMLSIAILFVLVRLK